MHLPPRWPPETPMALGGKVGSPGRIILKKSHSARCRSGVTSRRVYTSAPRRGELPARPAPRPSTRRRRSLLVKLTAPQALASLEPLSRRSEQRTRESGRACRPAHSRILKYGRDTGRAPARAPRKRARKRRGGGGRAAQPQTASHDALPYGRSMTVHSWQRAPLSWRHQKQHQWRRQNQ